MRMAVRPIDIQYVDYMHPELGGTNKRIADSLAHREGQIQLSSGSRIAARFYPVCISWASSSHRVMSCWGSLPVGIRRDWVAEGSIIGLPKVPYFTFAKDGSSFQLGARHRSAGSWLRSMDFGRIVLREVHLGTNPVDSLVDNTGIQSKLHRQSLMDSYFRRGKIRQICRTNAFEIGGST